MRADGFTPAAISRREIPWYTQFLQPRADRPARRHRGHDEEGAGRAEAADAEAAGVVQRAELDGGFSACSLVLACRGQHQTQ